MTMSQSTTDANESTGTMQENNRERRLLKVAMLAVGFFFLFPPVVKVKSGATNFSFLFQLSSNERIDVFMLLAIWIGILVIASIYWEFLQICPQRTEDRSRRNPLKLLVVVLFAGCLLGGIGDVSSSVGALRHDVGEVASSIDALESEMQDCHQN
jgi:hypothetical protein